MKPFPFAIWPERLKKGVREEIEDIDASAQQRGARYIDPQYKVPPIGHLAHGPFTADSRDAAENYDAFPDYKPSMRIYPKQSRESPIAPANVVGTAKQLRGLYTTLGSVQGLAAKVSTDIAQKLGYNKKATGVSGQTGSGSIANTGNIPLSTILQHDAIVAMHHRMLGDSPEYSMGAEKNRTGLPGDEQEGEDAASIRLYQGLQGLARYSGGSLLSALFPWSKRGAKPPTGNAGVDSKTVGFHGGNSGMFDPFMERGSPPVVDPQKGLAGPPEEGASGFYFTNIASEARNYVPDLMNIGQGDAKSHTFFPTKNDGGSLYRFLLPKSFSDLQNKRIFYLPEQSGTTFQSSISNDTDKLQQEAESGRIKNLQVPTIKRETGGKYQTGIQYLSTDKSARLKKWAEDMIKRHLGKTAEQLDGSFVPRILKTTDLSKYSNADYLEDAMSMARLFYPQFYTDKKEDGTLWGNNEARSARTALERHLFTMGLTAAGYDGTARFMDLPRLGYRSGSSTPFANIVQALQSKASTGNVLSQLNLQAITPTTFSLLPHAWNSVQYQGARNVPQYKEIKRGTGSPIGEKPFDPNSKDLTKTAIRLFSNIDTEGVQNTPHGRNSVLQHTQLGMSKLNTQGLDDRTAKLLQLAYFLHDVGKVEGAKDPDHPRKSVGIASDYLDAQQNNSFGLTDEERKLVEHLITWHDAYGHVLRELSPGNRTQEIYQIMKMPPEGSNNNFRSYAEIFTNPKTTNLLGRMWEADIEAIPGFATQEGSNANAFARHHTETPNANHELDKIGAESTEKQKNLVESLIEDVWRPSWSTKKSFMFRPFPFVIWPQGLRK